MSLNFLTCKVGMDYLLYGLALTCETDLTGLVLWIEQSMAAMYRELLFPGG